MRAEQLIAHLWQQQRGWDVHVLALQSCAHSNAARYGVSFPVRGRSSVQTRFYLNMLGRPLLQFCRSPKSLLSVLQSAIGVQEVCGRGNRGATDRDGDQ